MHAVTERSGRTTKVTALAQVIKLSRGGHIRLIIQGGKRYVNRETYFAQVY